ncbi:MAG: hypothetical protein LBB52_00385 [Desulfovibrio sp.]|nr:hypothetical protein [Desulfovibrio sp.]
MDNSSSGSFIASGKGKNLPADPALGRPLAEDGIISVWPAPWKEIFGRTIRAPLLWTYRELGRDLTGQGNPDRAKFLRDLISCLDLPRGSNAFWPVSLASDADAPTDDAAAISREEQLIFYQGVQLIRPLLVIFFGTECADMAVLGFGDLSPFSFRIKDGALYIFFPSLQYLLANSAAVGLCADFLLHVFTEFPSLDEQVRRHRNQ